jgi:hypothetical protein
MLLGSHMFSPKDNYVFAKHLQAGWDGKIRKQWGIKSDFLGLNVIGYGMEKKKVLGDIPIPEGTGDMMASTVNRLLREWGIWSRVFGIQFDTTSSNTGCNIGKNKFLTRVFRREEAPL